MKYAFFITLGLVAWLAAGCSSTPTKVSTGPIHAATFSFIGGGAGATPDFADKREQVHVMIQDAISQDLESKGLKMEKTGGDVIVAYLVIIGDNVSTEAIDTYFGNGRNTDALHDKAQAAYTGSKNPNNFEAGTLLIDIIDGKTYKLLERSYVTRPLLRAAAADVRAGNIDEAVKAALKDVRVAH